MANQPQNKQTHKKSLADNNPLNPDTGGQALSAWIGFPFVWLNIKICLFPFLIVNGVHFSMTALQRREFYFISRKMSLWYQNHSKKESLYGEMLLSGFQ